MTPKTADKTVRCEMLDTEDIVPGPITGSTSGGTPMRLGGTPMRLGSDQNKDEWHSPNVGDGRELFQSPS
jgi:hypothetical protein